MTRNQDLEQLHFSPELQEAGRSTEALADPSACPVGTETGLSAQKTAFEEPSEQPPKEPFEELSEDPFEEPSEERGAPVGYQTQTLSVYLLHQNLDRRLPSSQQTLWGRWTPTGTI